MIKRPNSYGGSAGDFMWILTEFQEFTSKNLIEIDGNSGNGGSCQRWAFGSTNPKTTVEPKFKKSVFGLHI
jgi:hypothetical protein